MRNVNERINPVSYRLTQSAKAIEGRQPSEYQFAVECKIENNILFIGLNISGCNEIGRLCPIFFDIPTYAFFRKRVLFGRSLFYSY